MLRTAARTRSTALGPVEAAERCRPRSPGAPGCLKMPVCESPFRNPLAQRLHGARIRAFGGPQTRDLAVPPKVQMGALPGPAGPSVLPGGPGSRSSLDLIGARSAGQTSRSFWPSRGGARPEGDACGPHGRAEQGPPRRVRRNAILARYEGPRVAHDLNTIWIRQTREGGGRNIILFSRNLAVRSFLVATAVTPGAGRSGPPNISVAGSV